MREFNTLFLTSQLLGHGGIQYVGRLLIDAIRDLAGHNANVTVVSVADPAGINDTDQLQCLLHGAAGHSFVVARNWFLYRTFRKWDLIILGHVNLAPLLLVQPIWARVPSVGWIYGIEAWKPMSRSCRWGLARLDKLLYISDYTRTAAIASNPWLRTIPSNVCHLALRSSPANNAAPTPDGGNRNSQYALVIGRMSLSERYKGHEELIRAWPHVTKSRPDLRLAIVGGGDDRIRLESLAKHLSANVDFHGEVSDDVRDQLLARCKCFCLPSRGEGFGLVYLEAMRAAKPVLAGNSDAAREIVFDGETGRTVDPLDQTALCQAVIDVSGPKSEAMGRAGRQRFEDQFSYAMFQSRFRDIVGDLISDPHNRF